MPRCPSACQPACQPAGLPACRPAGLPAGLSVCLLACRSVGPSVSASVLQIDTPEQVLSEAQRPEPIEASLTLTQRRSAEETNTDRSRPLGHEEVRRKLAADLDRSTAVHEKGPGACVSVCLQTLCVRVCVCVCVSERESLCDCVWAACVCAKAEAQASHLVGRRLAGWQLSQGSAHPAVSSPHRALKPPRSLLRLCAKPRQVCHYQI